MARDVIHNAVKNALIKDGWDITADPYTIKFKGAKVFVDLATEMPIAAERGGERIAVEIKSFLGASPLHELEAALGQFIVEQENLSLAVVNTATEEVVKWIN